MVAGFGFRRGGKSAIDEPLSAEQVWSRLLAWQTRREHTQHELKAKLSQLGVTSELAEQSLAKLVDYGLQDDDRCAEGIVRGQLQRGRGRRAIAQRLQQKGLAAEHPALDEQTENLDWVKEAATLLQRRFGDTPIDDPKAQAKRVRFLQYRGFSLTQAIEAMKSLKSN
ncbi:MAG: regulatory protein [Paraperlucidibaca sp.]